MDKSIPKVSLLKALQTARVELQDMKLKKSGKNTYSNFAYYELSDILPAINLLCLKHNLFTRFNIIPSKDVERAILTLYNTSNEEKIEFVAPTAEAFIGKKKDGTGGADPIQNLGGKITYMRRYMLLTAFEMVENDMVDIIKREMAEELTDEDLKKIENAKTFEELTNVCGKLKVQYKASVIKPHYDKRKEELEDKVVKKTK